MDPSAPTMTPDTDHTWLLDRLLDDAQPATKHAVVLSKDGLKLYDTGALSEDQAETFAAVASGIQSLSASASRALGDGSGGVRQSMSEFDGGLLVIIDAGDGTLLAVLAEPESDPGFLGHKMTELVEQIGTHLVAPPRDTEGIGQS